MKYDLEKTFKFVSNDKDWIKKLLIGTGIGFLAAILFILPIILLALTKNPKIMPLLVIFWITAILLTMGINGFALQTAHDYINNPETQLPEWHNFKSLMFIGCKAALGTALLFLPVIFLAILATALLHSAKISGTPNHASTINIIYNIINLFYTFMLYAFSANFIKDFNIFDYVNYVKVYKLLKGNMLNYGLLVIIILAIGIVFNIAAVLSALTIVGILVIPFIAIYVQIITTILTARFVQITREPKEPQEC